MALALSKRILLPEDEQYAAEQWMEICADLQTVARTADISLVANRIGWSARLECLQWRGFDETTTSANTDAVNFCMSWDRLSPEGARRIYEERRGVQIVTGEKVALAHDKAPSGRGTLRGAHIA